MTSSYEYVNKMSNILSPSKKTIERILSIYEKWETATDLEINWVRTLLEIEGKFRIESMESMECETLMCIQFPNSLTVVMILREGEPMDLSIPWG